jgi:phosphatidylglycerol---prolipoprotein diacylglyceryl transferase
MFPVIYQFNKFLSINGYGIMLGLGFYLSFLLIEREFKRKSFHPDLAYRILLTAIICGIVGSKIFDILENLNSFLANPWETLFSGSGLSAYGGYVLSFIMAVFVIKKSKESIIKVFDATAPALALGYTFGRFGCHVAGDGCFGIATSGFWATAYPNGIVPSTITVYPTPLFESLFSFIAFGILMNMRKRELPDGILISSFLILSGLPRFLVEFIRRNPKLVFGLSQAQVVGIIFMICGIAGWFYFNKNKKALA